MIRSASILLALGLATSALAGTPQHPALDGPFSVPTVWTSGTDPSGNPIQVPTAFQANRWNTTPAFYAACPALAAYRIAPTSYGRVWAGDNAAAPSWTIALLFPDAATAETKLLACGATEPPP